MHAPFVSDVDPGSSDVAPDDAVAPTWDEPRGPHLPDRLTAIPPLVWPFLVIAALQVWDAVPSLRDAASEPEQIFVTLVGLLAQIAPTLYGAALFWRHPDAWRSLRMLAIGVALVAIVAVAHLGTTRAHEILDAAWPPADDQLFGSWASFLYDVSLSVLGLVAVLSLARGLADVRRFEDPPATRRLRLAVGILATLVAAFIIARFLSDLLPASSSSQELLVRNLVALVLAVARLGSWAYLTAVAGVGWLARERPRTGWALAAAAGLATFAIQMPIAWLWFSLPSEVTVLAFLGGPALLLVAFLVGLPSTEPAGAEEGATDPEPRSDASGDATEPVATVDGSGPAGFGVRP